MDSFQIAFNAIVPITLIVIMGYLLKKYKHLDKHTITNINLIEIGRASCRERV